MVMEAALMKPYRVAFRDNTSSDCWQRIDFDTREAALAAYYERTAAGHDVVFYALHELEGVATYDPVYLPDAAEKEAYLAMLWDALSRAQRQEKDVPKEEVRIGDIVVESAGVGSDGGTIGIVIDVLHGLAPWPVVRVQTEYGVTSFKRWRRYRPEEDDTQEGE
jgi:hypothetical protein